MGEIKSGDFFVSVWDSTGNNPQKKDPLKNPQKKKLGIFWGFGKKNK